MVKISRIDFTPVAGYLLIKPLEDTQAIGGVEIHGGDDRPQFGKVLKVGLSTWYENSDRVLESPCNVGDTIVHSSVGFENVRIEGEEYRLLPFSRVLMVK